MTSHTFSTSLTVYDVPGTTQDRLVKLSIAWLRSVGISWQNGLMTSGSTLALSRQLRHLGADAACSLASNLQVKLGQTLTLTLQFCLQGQAAHIASSCWHV